MFIVWHLKPKAVETLPDTEIRFECIRARAHPQVGEEGGAYAFR
jgi:hypothetical protein